MSKTLVSLVLFFVIICAGVSAFTPPQNPQRERRATSSPTATPTSAPSATPSPTQTPLPSPTPARTPLRAETTKTLAELQIRIAAILAKPELAPAMVGIKVASLDTGRVLFEENANKLLRPASNMKLYTVSAAIDRLSPDFRFTTSVYAAARPDDAGVIHGDLTIYGRGDPSLAARFNKGDYFKGIDDLAAAISLGVKRVEGDLVGDESYFTGPPYGSGWEWEDLQWWYGAEVSALTVNDNALDLFIKPGLQVRAPASVTTGPPDPLLTIVNNLKTGPKGSKRELKVYRGLGENTLEISGSIPLDDKGRTEGIGISHPALLFATLLRNALAQHGVTVSGQSRTAGARSSTDLSLCLARSATASAGTTATGTDACGFVIANMQSPPFNVVAANTLKPSQNLYTEIILRTLGKMAAVPGSELTRTSEDAGLEVVKTFLKEAGVSPASLVFSDGSGLSRNDMVTANATLQLLTYMSRHKYAAVLRDALPVAGVDGTLRNRLKGTVAEGNVRAKTGSLASAASLSGYLTTAAGEKLVFSIMVNNFPSDVEPREVCIDPIAVLLASFAGRT